MFSRRLPLIFHSFFGLSSRHSATTASSVPNSPISCAAVLGPIPGTPGTLSAVSPISASMSTTCPGSSPVSSLSVAEVIKPSVWMSYISVSGVPPPRSCLRSLSLLTIRTRTSGCASLYRVAIAAITSSASNPSAPITGTPIASSNSRHRST